MCRIYSSGRAQDIVSACVLFCVAALTFAAVVAHKSCAHARRCTRVQHARCAAPGTLKCQVLFGGAGWRVCVSVYICESRRPSRDDEWIIKNTKTLKSCYRRDTLVCVFTRATKPTTMKGVVCKQTRCVHNDTLTQTQTLSGGTSRTNVPTVL